jgi:hypothetical protein
VFEFARYLNDTNIRLRVECDLYATDEDRPIRLVICDATGTEKAYLRFTPERARDSAYSLARLLSQFLPHTDSYRLAEGLRTAALKVWAARN